MSVTGRQFPPARQNETAFRQEGCFVLNPVGCRIATADEAEAVYKIPAQRVDEQHACHGNYQEIATQPEQIRE